MKNLFLLIIILFIVTGCGPVSRYAYSPATANLLQVEKTGDAKLAAGYSSTSNSFSQNDLLDSKKSNGIDLQGMYAFSKRGAVGAAWYKKWEENRLVNQTNPSAYRYDRNGLDISAGIYNFSKNGERSNFQLFGGVGFGNSEIKSLIPAGGNAEYHYSKYNKYFLQPTLSLKATERYLIVLASRINLINFHNIETNITDLDRDGLIYLGQKKSVFQDFILNQSYTFKNSGGIGIQLQLGITGLYTRFSDVNNINTGYKYNNLWISGGITWDIKEGLKK